MTETDRYVLQAAAEKMTRHNGNSWEAHELYETMEDPELRLDDVSLALLHLRDQGCVITEPTVGDPMDGKYRFRLTDEGKELASRGGDL